MCTNTLITNKQQDIAPTRKSALKHNKPHKPNSECSHQPFSSLLEFYTMKYTHSAHSDKQSFKSKRGKVYVVCRLSLIAQKSAN